MSLGSGCHTGDASFPRHGHMKLAMIQSHLDHRRVTEVLTDTKDIHSHRSHLGGHQRSILLLGSITAATMGDSCWKPTKCSSFAVSPRTPGGTGIGQPFKDQSCRTCSKLANGLIKSQANHGWGPSQRRPGGTHQMQLLRGVAQNSCRDGNWTTVQRSILSYLFQTSQWCHQKSSYPCLGSIKAATMGD